MTIDDLVLALDNQTASLQVASDSLSFLVLGIGLVFCFGIGVISGSNLV